MDDKEISKGKIVEPIFDEPQYGIISPTPEHEKVVPHEAVMMPAELVELTGAPTTKHCSEMEEELKYYSRRGTSLLWNLHYAAFTQLDVSTQLTVPGVWEVGETAEYKVKVCNYTTYLDLKDIDVTLYVSNIAGTAKIISPPGTVLHLGDIDYNSCKSDTFRVEGVESGDVLFYLRIGGYIGSFKYYLHYYGKSWNGSSWITKHPYLVKYHIH